MSASMKMAAFWVVCAVWSGSPMFPNCYCQHNQSDEEKKRGLVWRRQRAERAYSLFAIQRVMFRAPLIQTACFTPQSEKLPHAAGTGVNSSNIRSIFATLTVTKRQALYFMYIKQ
jgi:hypothetical protein